MQFATRKKPTSQSMQDIVPMVDVLLVALEKENIINDQRLGESLARQWSTRLMPWRKIEMKLTAKGFSRDTIAAIKDNADSTDSMADEDTLARDYAARKKLGVFRPAATEQDAPDSTAAQKKYQKDLAKMARAGFSYGAAQRALKP